MKIRPHVAKFLRSMSLFYDILVFTAAAADYAEAVVSALDPERQFIRYVLSREHCLLTKEGENIKDLRMLRGVDLRNVVLVDNLSHSFAFQVENGIPIVTWRGEAWDNELRYLQNYLADAYWSQDVRVFNRERLRLREFARIKSDCLP
jgi:CTD small phosphatase-like protein 2